jgi:hypothetical protein
MYTSYLQDNWVDLLPCAEFAYNNSVHSSTGFTPFYAFAGINPRGPEGSATGLTDKPDTLAQYMSEISQFLSANLEQAAADMKRFADRSRTPAPKYSAGDKVLISTKNIASPRPKTKWSDKWMGPYKVISEAYPNSDAYVLDLPPSVQMHKVFHTSLLMPYKESTLPGRRQPPPPPIIMNGNKEYEVNEVLFCKWKKGHLKYWVSWKGYSPKDNSWVDVEYMDNAQELVDEFHKTYPMPDKPSYKKRSAKRRKT